MHSSNRPHQVTDRNAALLASVLAPLLVHGSFAAANPPTADGTICSNPYIFDDGGADVAYIGGPPLSGAAWLNQFEIEAGRESIVGIQVCWVGWTGTDKFLPLGHPVTIVVLADPNGDGLPADAIALLTLETVVQVDAPNTFQTISFPDLVVGEAGGAFFAGVFATMPAVQPEPPCLHCPSYYYPSCADSSNPESTVSWIGPWFPDVGGLIDFADFVNLAAEGYPMTFMIRAVPAPSFVGDLDCDGTINGADLGVLLSQWGPCPRSIACAGDLDGDGAVGASDIGVLLAAWD